jgi:hypothetical protein
MTNPPKIIINGKEIDTAKLPPGLRDLSSLPPEIRALLEDKNNDGVPDIADNPFAAMAKLAKLASVAKDMPVLLSQMKTPAERKDARDFIVEEARTIIESEDESPATVPASGMAASRSSRPAKTKSSQAWLSSSPPVKKDTGRKVLFWMVILGIAGWSVYQYLVGKGVEMPF